MYRVTQTEDVQKFIIPANSLSEQIYYNQRFLLDNRVDVNNGAEPRAWKITKINRISSNGVILATLAQDEFNPHTDYVEYEDPTDPSTIVGMWANYYGDSGVTPTEPTVPQDTVYATITSSGVSPALKVGGGYKKYSVNFFENEEPADFRRGNWSYIIDGNDATTLLSFSEAVEQNQIKIKFVGDDTYIGKILMLSYTTANGDVTATLEVPIMGL